MENTESTSRQYALRERARALGWAKERIVVIDQDLGHSGAWAADEEGLSPPQATRFEPVVRRVPALALAC